MPPEDLLVANGRFESTTWTATALGPPLGGAAIGLFGPVTTVVANAVSYLLSALGIRAIGGSEARPVRERTPTAASRRPARGMALHPGPPRAAPAVLQHGPRERPDPGDRAAARRAHARPARVRALAVRPRVRAALRRRPDRLAAGPPRLVARFGRHRVMLTAGALRACWSLGLAFIGPGAAGLLLVIAVEFGLVTSVGVFNPVFATYRLEQTPDDRVARTLSAWSVTSSATIAAMTAAVGPAGHRHEPAHRDRDRRPAPAHDPAPAPPPRAHATASARAPQRQACRGAVPDRQALVNTSVRSNVYRRAPSIFSAER